MAGSIETPETPEALFAAAVRAINEKFSPGVLEHTQANHPDLYGRIERALDGVNDTWARCIGPGAGLDSFKAALRAWYNSLMEAIKLYEGGTNER